MFPETFFAVVSTNGEITTERLIAPIDFSPFDSSVNDCNLVASVRILDTSYVNIDDSIVEYELKD